MMVLGAVLTFLVCSLSSTALQGATKTELAPRLVYNDATLPAWGFNASNSSKDRRDTTSSALISNQTAKYVDRLIKEWNSTGIALAVVQRDGTVTDQAHPGWRIEYGSYGSASKNAPASAKPVTPDTLFAIASNSKLFLALSVGLLIHNKTLTDNLKAKHGVELGWSTRVRDLLGEDWEMWDEDVTKGATIADLLTHRTGLPRHDFMRVWREGGVREQIQSLRYLRPSAKFRETFQYNNLMYETLSYLPELLLNQTYESYVTQHLLEPLNMTSTTFSNADIDAYPPQGNPIGRFAHRMADGHIASNRDLTLGKLGTLKPVIPFFSRPGEEWTRAGAGGIISTARDLATWNAMLLSGGKHPYNPNITVVPNEVLEWVTTGRSIFSGVPMSPETSPVLYGAGQLRYSYRGVDVIEHSGDTPGFKSLVSRYPRQGLGVVVLSNDGENGGWVMDATKWAVVDHLVFGEEEGRVKWSERFHAVVGAQRISRQAKVTPRPDHPEPPTRPFSELGKKNFEHPAYGNIVLCRVPLQLLRDPYSDYSPELSTPALDDDNYDNPYANCTELLSSPSVRHILSSTPHPSVSSSQPPQEPNDTSATGTFVARFTHSFVSHLRLVHFGGDLFNVSAVWVNDDVRRDLGIVSEHPSVDSQARTDEHPTTAQDPGAVLINLDETFTLEWVSDPGRDGGEGLAIRDGFWGMEGPDAREPAGKGAEGSLDPRNPGLRKWHGWTSRVTLHRLEGHWGVPYASC